MQTLHTCSLYQAAMETFLGATGQQLTSVLNLILMKRMDTGDRMLDTTLQMLLSTLIGGLITGLVTIYTKGMWGEVRNRARALWSATEYNPLEFDPRLAPDKPANGTNFLYKAFYESSEWTTFMSWFFVHHEAKYFPQKLGTSIYLPTKVHRRRTWEDDDSSAAEKKSTRRKREFSFLNRRDIQNGPGVRRFKIPSGVYLPIWRSNAGHYVYMNTNDDTIDDEDVCIFSDSAEAIRECMTSIYAHAGTMDAYEEELKRAGADGEPIERKIYDYVNDDVREKPNGINPKKTMDTLFFTQKEEVVRMLKGFKEGKLFGAHLPIDNKLGFLLYGPPGTGKTGLIAAVANYLGRDVVNIDTSRIKTRKALDAALEMDCRRNIFVFEEFDTMPGVGRREAAEGDGDCGDGGGQRSGAVTPGEGRDGGGPDMAQMAFMMMAGGAAKKDGGGGDFMEELREERKAAADKLDLGYLLRKLDGLESGNGRIIIATTNHPERIDPALLRPGRFGLQIHLTRCTRLMLREMVHMIYQVEHETPQSQALVEALEAVPELKWAPAELLQLGVTLPTVEDMVRHLVEKEPACFR